MRTRLAIYVNLYSVKELLSDNQKLSRFMSLLSELGISKIYIENYRDGVILDRDTIHKARRLFERDFDTAGGAAIGTWGPGMGENAGWWKALACISDEKNVDVYIKAVADLALVFDEIIIDDFWANWCFSQNDIENFNNMYGLNLDVKTISKMIWIDREIQRLWALYSRDLLLKVSQRIISRAKDVNKNIRIVLKLAEWRESYLQRGLDVKSLAEVFDGIYLGTESREGTFRFGSVFIVDYVRALVGDKLRGVWFDSYQGLVLPSSSLESESLSWRFPPMSPEIFVEQFWYSYLACVDEITLFQGTEYIAEDRKEHVALFKKAMSWLKQVEELIEASKRGLVVPAIQIVHRSPFDSYLEDALGSIGVPLTSKRIDKLSEGDIVLVKEDIVNYIDLWGLIKRGISIVLTSTASEIIARKMLGPDVLEVIGAEIDSPIIKTSIDAYAFIDGDRILIREHRRVYAYPVGPILRVKKDAKVYLSALSVDGSVYPVAYEVNHGSASVFVLPITRYVFDLVHNYPEHVRQVLRDIVFKYIGLKIDYRVPGAEFQDLSNVSVVLYSNKKSVALINNNMYEIFFSLVLDKDILGVKSLEGTAIDNTRSYATEDQGKVIRGYLGMTRHSIDILKIV